MIRDYAKVSPMFWTGETGKAIKRRGSDAVVAAFYLMSSPHSNMLGLYYQPLLYMAHESGLGIDEARKALQCCIDVGFCSYDAETEMVFVHEMAAWQIADELKAADLRVKGIQKDYDALPNCPFLEAFFDRYAAAFHLKKKRANTPHKAPKPADSGKGLTKGDSKPLRSQEQEQEQEQEQTPLPPASQGEPPGRVFDPEPEDGGDDAEDLAGPKPTPKQPRRATRRSAADKPATVPVEWLIAAGFEPQLAVEFIAHKDLLKAPLTERAWTLHQTEARKAGWSAAAAAERVIAKNWKGFEAKYVSGEAQPGKFLGSSWGRDPHTGVVL